MKIEQLRHESQERSPSAATQQDLQNLLSDLDTIQADMTWALGLVRESAPPTDTPTP
jgi:hypothetical protein